MCLLTACASRKNSRLQKPLRLTLPSDFPQTVWPLALRELAIIVVEIGVESKLLHGVHGVCVRIGFVVVLVLPFVVASIVLLLGDNVHLRRNRSAGLAVSMRLLGNRNWPLGGKFLDGSVVATKRRCSDLRAEAVRVRADFWLLAQTRSERRANFRAVFRLRCRRNAADVAVIGPPIGRLASATAIHSAAATAAAKRRPGLIAPGARLHPSATPKVVACLGSSGKAPSQRRVPSWFVP
mmetsp:Transcript_42705/g.117880  ORF Transcript_42705/g.117880 Transcript_42705/m.117880 type:complete len:238 (-) Transcript_42705:8-721(-)